VQGACAPQGQGRGLTARALGLVAQAEYVQHGLRTIAFCHTRKLCELVIAYTRETLRSTAPGLEGAIAVYRAGYSPKVRLGWHGWRPPEAPAPLASCSYSRGRCCVAAVERGAAGRSG